MREGKSEGGIKGAREGGREEGVRERGGCEGEGKSDGEGRE